ncbi:FixH family protein [Rhodopseudomonas palustris]|uniref:YtkA-like domain-containing protein n=1 Tax=Rhodopseudomonas palustris (strain BisB18) TaxID=316056 RepID=Q20XF5_RHOPB
MTTLRSRALAAALIGLGLFATAGFARADVKDYEFKLLDPVITAGKDKIVAVKLVNKTTGQPVSDAVIFATRLDMAPEGMAEMATKIALQPGSTEPGVYKFKATFGMEGKWLLSLGAKLQGETGTVEGKLVISANK